MSTQEITKPENTEVATPKSMVALGIFPPRFKGQSHRSLSMYVTDAKSVLWEVAVKLALDRGWNYRIIGIEDGEFGVDLCDGLEPGAVIAMIKDAMSQMTGGSGNSAAPIFENVALSMIRAGLNLLRTYELTDEGFAIVKARKERLFSLSHAYELVSDVLDPRGKVFKVVDAIQKAAQDPVAARNIAPLLTSDLWSDIKFLRKSLIQDYGRETVGSFLVNVQQMLSCFVTNPSVRSRFGAAKGRQVEIDDIWNDKTLTCFRLSPETGIGDSARMIAIMTKIRIYNRATVRQIIDPKIGTKAKLEIVMDEAQDLVTNGIYGESAVTAKSRSTGLSFSLASQCLSGYYDRIGENATHTLYANLRTKTFLQTEEPKDMEYVMKLGGKVRRSLMSAPNEYESWHARQLALTGFVNDDIKPLGLDEVDYSVSANDIFGDPQKIAVRPVSLVKLDKHNMLGKLRNLAHSSKKFTGAGSTDGGNEALENTAEYQAAQTELAMLNRHEDQTRALMTTGNEMQTLYSESDLQNLGMGQAIVFINSAGVLRTDIILVNPDLAKPRAARQNTIDVQAREVKPPGTPVPTAQIAQSAAEVVIAKRAMMAKQTVPARAL